MSDRISVLESEVLSLRQELSRVSTRQQRVDDSIVKMVQMLKPLLLLVGEAAVSIPGIRNSLARNIQKAMQVARELAPSTNAQGQ